MEVWRLPDRRQVRPCLSILDFPLTGPSWDTIHPVTEPSLPLAMHPSEHRLRQLDEAYLRSLDLEALRNRSARWLADLKDARARLDARVRRSFAVAATPRTHGVRAQPCGARRVHRDLPPARPRPVAHSRTGHRRPPRRTASRRLTPAGGLNGDVANNGVLNRAACSPGPFRLRSATINRPSEENLP